MDVKVNVEGARELRAAIKQAGTTDLQKELREAYRNTALAVSGRAYQLAPKFSGALADSIRPSASLTGAKVSAGNSAVPYAGPIHWGWPKRHIQAQPFISQALKQQQGDINRYFNDAIDQIGKKISTD